MSGPKCKLAVAALALAIAIPVAVTMSQAREPARPDGWSPELRGRLTDGRFAMIKEALKLDETQLRLWAPVEAQLRASHEASEQQRAERRARRESRDERSRERASLADRLERTSQRLTERAERTKALAGAFRPFYDALSDDQKAVANVVMPRMLGGFGGRHGYRRHADRMERR
jgi:septal ring factor EnvC (AmiA/AmiB activator)